MLSKAPTLPFTILLLTCLALLAPARASAQWEEAEESRAIGNAAKKDSSSPATLRNYIGVRGAAGLYFIQPSMPGLGRYPAIANSLALYRASNNPVYFQPELVLTMQNVRTERETYNSTQLEMPLLLALDARYVSFKMGLNVGVTDIGRKAMLGMGLLGALGIRYQELELDFRGGYYAASYTQNTKTDFGVAYVSFGVGYLFVLTEKW